MKKDIAKSCYHVNCGNRKSPKLQNLWLIEEPFYSTELVRKNNVMILKGGKVHRIMIQQRDKMW